MIHFLDTEEGKAIAEKNLGVIGIKGMAITKIGYTKLGNLLHGLNPKIDLFYMRNQKEPVSFFAAWWMPANTNGFGHDNMEYNNSLYDLKENGKYQRKINENGKAISSFNYQMRKMDGKDMRSIIERWKDKRAQEKRMEENK